MENSFDASGFRYRLSVSEAAQELRSGHVLIIVDHVNKVANACQALQFVNADALNAIKAVTPEEIYVVLSGERAETLQIPLFPGDSGDSIQDSGPATTLDVCPNRHASSAYSTMQMMHALIDPATQPGDIAQPGRLAVLRTYPGGLLKRRSAAEAVSDLLRIAGLEPGALLCKLDMQGESIDAVLSALAEQWKSGVIALEDIIRYRKEHHVSLITETQLPTQSAVFRLRHYQEIETGKPYLALLLGDSANEAHALEGHHADKAPLVRLHSACATGDIFGSQRCDCQAQLHAALQKIAEEGRGLLLYLPQEGRGIGLSGKLQAYALQEQGYDTLEANLHLGYPIDARDYSIALEILRDLGLTHIRLMTNNPEKIDALQSGGIVIENVPLEVSPNPHNHYYLQTKWQRMGHLFLML
ncbi:MAG: bifunctional 3,4-dihydroxy-2-butanone-4-phosphate synthase/GTP cyclohydrolase II [Ktedonobacteraceae bacterium]